MDYATSPVPVTPVPQATASVSRSHSPAGVTGFNGLLQSAASDAASAGLVHGEKSAQSETPDTAVGTAVPQTDAKGNESAVAGKIVPVDTENGQSTNSLTGSTLALQHDTHAIAMAMELGATVQPTVTTDITGTDTTTVKSPVAAAAVLPQALVAHAGPKAGAPTYLVSTRPPASGDLSGTTGPDLQPLDIKQNNNNTLPAATTAADGLRTGSLAPGNSAAVSVGGAVVTLPSRGLDLSTPVSVASTAMAAKMAAKTTDVSVAHATWQGSSDPVLIAGRVGSAPLLHGMSATTDAAVADQPASPRVVPAVGNTVLPVAANATAASVELTSSNAAGVSAAATTITTARELMARQRSGTATSDQTVSQISRGGTEARILEVNGVRTTSAVAPAGNPVVSLPVESTTGLTEKHTNAVTLAASREEKLLQVSATTQNQTQPLSKIAGVDVAQPAAVDLAAVRLDATTPSQPIPRLSILEPGWTSQLGSDLRALVARGTSTTQLQVTPAELGPLDIEVSINRQEVSVRILAMHGQTREMLEAALPRLRDTLGQNYASVDVSVGSGSGNSTSGGQQHNGQAGTLGMMSGNQDGLPDTGASRNTAGAEGGDSEEGANDLSLKDQEGANDGSVVAANSAPARGLVDAYA